MALKDARLFLSWLPLKVALLVFVGTELALCLFELYPWPGSDQHRLRVSLQAVEALICLGVIYAALLSNRPHRWIVVYLLYNAIDITYMQVYGHYATVLEQYIHPGGVWINNKELNATRWNAELASVFVHPFVPMIAYRQCFYGILGGCTWLIVYRAMTAEDTDGRKFHIEPNMPTLCYVLDWVARRLYNSVVWLAEISSQACTAHTLLACQIGQASLILLFALPYAQFHVAAAEVLQIGVCALGICALAKKASPSTPIMVGVVCALMLNVLFVQLFAMGRLLTHHYEDKWISADEWARFDAFELHELFVKRMRSRLLVFVIGLNIHFTTSFCAITAYYRASTTAPTQSTRSKAADEENVTGEVLESILLDSFGADESTTTGVHQPAPAATPQENAAVKRECLSRGDRQQIVLFLFILITVFLVTSLFRQEILLGMSRFEEAVPLCERENSEKYSSIPTHSISKRFTDFPFFPHPHSHLPYSIHNDSVHAAQYDSNPICPYTKYSEDVLPSALSCGRVFPVACPCADSHVRWVCLGDWKLSCQPVTQPGEARKERECQCATSEAVKLGFIFAGSSQVMLVIAWAVNIFMKCRKRRASEGLHEALLQAAQGLKEATAAHARGRTSVSASDN